MTFTSNGLGWLNECLSCTVTEERNGIYECEFEYPITGKWYDRMVTQGGCVGVYHDDKHDLQPFDIYSYTAPISGVVTFYAHHISYRLNSVILEPFTASSIAQLMTQIPTHSTTTNHFTFWTDKASSKEYKLTHPDNCRSILAGKEGSILDVYGTGEYLFDKFNVKLYLHRGVETGATIRYGKNLVDIVKEFDRSGTCNGVAPYWTSEDGTVVMLPEIYVLSDEAPPNALAPWTNENDVNITDNNGEIIEFTYATARVLPLDMTNSFQEQPTVEELREKAIEYLHNNKPWIPKENIKINFVQLWQTPEYEDVAFLQRVALCDKVSVYYPELGVVAENQEVIKVVYNVLTESYDSMELGKPQVSLAQTIEQAVYSNVDTQIADFGNVMKAAIDHATEMITGGLGGFVVFTLNGDGQPQEILIMDTDNVNTAVNVIRMNKNGIGFSHNGYQGQYESAWTIDGQFVADFITAGTLNANIIKAGILSDYFGRNYWNLETGEFSLQGYATETYANQTASAAASGAEQSAKTYADTVASDAEASAKDYADTVSASSEAAAKQYADSAAANAVALQTQLSIFNKLTNNGQTQGIYLNDNKIYINADYIHGGTLELGGLNNANGMLAVYDANGNEVGRIDNTGANLTGNVTLRNTAVEVFNGLAQIWEYYIVEGWQQVYRYSFIRKFWQQDYNPSSSSSTNPLVINTQSTTANGQSFYDVVRLDDQITSYVREVGWITNASNYTAIYERLTSSAYHLGFANGVGIEFLKSGKTTVDSYYGTLSLDNNSIYYATTTNSYVFRVTNSIIRLGLGSTTYFRLDSSTQDYIDIRKGVAHIQINTSPSGGSGSGNILITSGQSVNSHELKLEINGVPGGNTQGSSTYYVVGRIAGYALAFYQSSSRRYKHDIKPLTDANLDPHKLLEIPVRQFVFDKEHEYGDLPDAAIPGFIAEEVEEIYPIAVMHQAGKVESWDEKRIIPGMLALIQEQHKRIEDLEERIEKLERLVNKLVN